MARTVSILSPIHINVPNPLVPRPYVRSTNFLCVKKDPRKQAYLAAHPPQSRDRHAIMSSRFPSHGCYYEDRSNSLTPAADYGELFSLRPFPSSYPPSPSCNTSFFSLFIWRLRSGCYYLPNRCVCAPGDRASAPVLTLRREVVVAGRYPEKSRVCLSRPA